MGSLYKIRAELDELASDFGGEDTEEGSSWGFDTASSAKKFARAAKKLKFVTKATIHGDTVEIDLAESWNEDMTHSITDLLEDLAELLILEASKSALRRRAQASSGDKTTPGMQAQLRHKQKQQASRKAKRYGGGRRQKRKKNDNRRRDIIRGQKISQLKHSMRGAAMSSGG